MNTTALRSYGSDVLNKHAALLASACLATYYALSSSSDLSLYDSGELALAAVQLGLGHPPGQPLHTIIGHVFARLTGSAPLIGVNLLSALPAALTLLPATSIAVQLTAARERARTATWAPWLLLLFALHESLWEPATRVEVYTLANLFAVCAVACALPLLELQSERREVIRRTALAGVILGLCASSNPAIAVGAGLALAPGIVQAGWRARAPLQTVAVAVLGGVLGLSPYLYLPLAAARSDVMVWGGLDDAASYWRYLTLGDYGRNQAISWFETLEHAMVWLGWSVEHLLMPVLLLGFGAFSAARSRLRFSRLLFLVAFAWSLTMISHTTVWNLEIPDYNGYLGMAYWLAAAGACALFARCAANQQRLACAAIALCMGAAVFSPPAPGTRTRAADHLARTLAEQVFAEAPPGAILVSSSDYFAGTFFYLQEVERKRPDVAVLVYGLSGSSWHWRRLQALHPGLAPADLTKRGPRETRVRNWLAANGDRPVLVERYALARALELRTCAGGMYFSTGALCDTPSTLAPATARLLSDQLARLGGGSPGAAGAIAEVSEQIGLGLWSLGQPEAAHRTLMAGVPQSWWPAKLADAGRLASAQQLLAPMPVWSRRVALGDPARNLFLAGAVAAASGQTQAAQRYVQAAASLHLPEAQAMLTKER